MLTFDCVRKQNPLDFLGSRKISDHLLAYLEAPFHLFPMWVRMLKLLIASLILSVWSLTALIENPMTWICWCTYWTRDFDTADIWAGWQRFKSSHLWTSLSCSIVATLGHLSTPLRGYLSSFGTWQDYGLLLPGILYPSNDCTEIEVMITRSWMQYLSH